MPLYDFRCSRCRSEFEAFASPGASATCPECGAPGAERIFSAFAGPFLVAPRGVAAKRSNAKRVAREEQRQERQELRRQAREQGPSSP